jgi:hypothetical protein
MGNSKIVIGFDIDGTLVDHADAKIAFAASRGIALPPEETPSDIMKSRFPKELVRDMQRYIYESTEGGTGQPLMPGVKETLVALRENEIPFFFISRRRGDKSKKNAFIILERNGILGRYINKEKIIFLPTIGEKAAAAHERGVTHFLDDEVKALKAMSLVSHRIFFDQFDIFENIFPFPRVTKRVDGIIDHFL